MTRPPKDRRSHKNKTVRNKTLHRTLGMEPLEARQLLAGIPGLLKNIAPDEIEISSSGPSNFVELNGSTLFTAEGDQLWKSDGTTAGTTLVKDLGTIGTSAYISHVHVHNGTLVLTSLDLGATSSPSDDRAQLWKSDGTTAGTVLVHDFGVDSGLQYSSDGVYFASSGGTLFFSMRTTGSGSELWKSESLGTPTLVKEIRAGALGSNPESITAFDGKVFFTASDGVLGRELWRSDGTSVGTVLVKDVEAGSNWGVPFTTFAELGGELFFGAQNSGADGISFTADDLTQFWKTDGSTLGTVLVKDFGVAGPYGYSSGYLVTIGSTIFSDVGTQTHGTELWKSDGTTLGTVLVKDINTATSGGYGLGSSPRNLTAVGGTLFFSADDGTNERELWKSDGTVTGTVLVKDIEPSTGAYGAYSSYPYGLVDVDGVLYFQAGVSDIGTELWKSDGTTGGTVLVQDINTNLADGSYPSYLTYSNGSLFFGAFDGTSGFEPWVIANVGTRDDLSAWHPNGNIYVARSTGTSFETTAWANVANVAWEDVQSGDMTGDGLADIVLRHPDGRVYVAESDGTSFDTQKWTTWANVAWDDVLAADFDGDGKTDLTMRHPNGKLYVARSTGSGFDNQLWGNLAAVDWLDVKVGDFNGDGLADLTLRHPNNSVYVARSTGTSFVTEKWTTWGDIAWIDVQVGDFNADGNDDLFMRLGNGNTYVASSNGTSFANQLWSKWAPVGWLDVRVADFTGDGQTDVTMRHPNGSVYVARSGGVSFVNEKWTTWANVAWTDLRVGQFDDDDLADLAMRHPNGKVYVASSQGNSFQTEVWATWANASWTNVLSNRFVTGGTDPTPIQGGGPGGSLLAADAGPGTNEQLDPSQIPSILSAALARWPGGDSLGDIQVQIGDLPGRELGRAQGNTIWIDDDAAGWGWFIDQTPWDDSEFTLEGDQGEQGRIDLLSVLAHELGHLLGYEHAVDGVMSELLGTGVRFK